jgi:hypothetical protein
MAYENFKIAPFVGGIGAGHDTGSLKRPASWKRDTGARHRFADYENLILIFVDCKTGKGRYHYTAIRDAADPDSGAWYQVEARVHIQ